MSEEPMLERVARVIEPQAWAALGTGDTLAYKNRRTSSLRKARAAIEQMCKPSDAFLEACHERVHAARFIKPNESYPVLLSHLRSIVEAALEGK